MGRKSLNSNMPDEGPVTMKHVARAAGVGVGTVSRVINATGGVSAKTREKVESAIVALGFRPNPIAQSMRSGQTKTLACVVRDFSVPVLSMFVNAMQATVDAQGFGLQVASSYHDIPREIEILRRMAQRRTDGIVAATSSEKDAAFLKVLAELPVPVVLLDRDEPQALDAVLIDHRYGVKAAISHLLDLGHRRITMIAGHADVRPTTERVAGFREAFAKHGLTPPPGAIRIGSFGTEHHYSEVALLLRQPDRPTAIFAGGTAMLAGVLRAVRDAGLRIPEDISLISGADSELALLHSPGITTVHWHHDQLGQMAAKFLLQRLAEPRTPRQRMIFPTELLIRGSCAPVRPAAGEAAGTPPEREPIPAS